MPLGINFSFLQQNPIKKEYDIGGDLGRGKFATVKQATHKSSGKQVAIKIINKENCKREDQMAKLESEIAIMKKVHHPNCIEFYEMYDSSAKLYIVMELVTGGELFDRVIMKAHYSETEAAGCFIQIMSAIEYLHSIGIVHRDIKPENVLYQSHAEDSPIKLADFGLGKLLDLHGADSKAAMMTVCGTPSYLAPEVIQHKGYGMECDVWSAGVILYILLSGAPPFDQTAPMPLLFKYIINQRYSFSDVDGDSDDAKDIISNMMVVDISKRLTPRGVLEHPWLRRYQKSELPTAQMSGMQQRLKDWNGARRLKGAISTFAALMRMSSSLLEELPDHAEQEAILAKVRSDEARMQVLRESFDMLDRDKTGVINLQNIQDSLQALNFLKTPVELKNMLKRFDVRNTGEIDFDEFCIMMGPAYYMRKESAHEHESELANIFDAFDLQRTGTINPAELKEILSRLGTKLTDEELNDMVRQADSNSDGVIDYPEFKAFLESHIQPSSTGEMEVTA
eukprot:CAMPEP_0181322842 /NCGR_PEP_ID=MMETSP1101-20121128/19450_1 /TAXON_ID=46948 /ORGANISM="Rhodomonas abbreviata, Strain Caron Lab Isolate" /LENGTH=508 /DNA_ID=CAMNT_0023430795 /DNA_START=99 /DNA_END=1623 /DNA_ORIENTATION=-